MTHLDADDPGRAAALAAPWSLARTLRVLISPERPGWRDARLLSFDTDVDAAAARRWLPPGLRPSEPARATWFVADYPDTSFGVAYRECGLLLHARRFGRPVTHCAWMVVDDDTALILGRELLGFPKKMAVIDIAASGDRWRATVARRGVELLSVDAELGADLPPARAFPLPLVNLRGFPGLVPSLLWRMEITEHFRAGRAATLSVRLQGSDADPLHELFAGAVTCAGRWLNVDLGTPSTTAAVARVAWPIRPVSPAWLLRRLPLRTL